MRDSRTDILLEDIQSKLQLLVKVTGVLAQDMREVKRTIASIPQMAADIETIKAVQADQGRELRFIEKYLTAQGMPARA